MWLNINPCEMVEVVILPVFEVPVLVKKWDGMRITFLFFEISRYFPYKNVCYCHARSVPKRILDDASYSLFGSSKWPKRLSKSGMLVNSMYSYVGCFEFLRRTYEFLRPKKPRNKKTQMRNNPIRGVLFEGFAAPER